MSSVPLVNLLRRLSKGKVVMFRRGSQQSDIDHVEAKMYDLLNYLSLLPPPINQFILEYWRTIENFHTSFIELYQEQAIRNDPLAQARIGYCFEHGLYNNNNMKKDYTQAYHYYTLSSQQDNGEGLAGLGSLYLHGYSVEKDIQKGLKFIQIAIAQESSRGYGLLGLCYYLGLGVTQDYKEAVKYYKLAIEKGNDLDSQYHLGICYLKGRGVTKDYKEAVRIFRIGVDQGMPAAQCSLATCYIFNLGVTSNDKEALRLYQAAAKHGLANAQECLGRLYQHGLAGVSKDEGRALYWYRLAAAQGHEKAKKQIPLLLRTANTTPPQLKKELPVKS